MKPLVILRLALAWLLACGFALGAPADPGKAQASFSPATTTVGDVVQLSIQVIGEADVDHPPRMKVDGLDILYRGPNSQQNFQFENGRMTSTSSVTYIYEVTPKKAGTYTLPAVEVRVGTRNVLTAPVTLQVAERGAAPPAGEGIDGVGHAEIALAKKSMFVGEAIAAEVRLFVDSQIDFRSTPMPTLEAGAFTKMKFGNMRTTTTTRDGRSYDVAISPTVLTPTRAGKLSVGPAEIDYQMQVPRAQPARRDPFGRSLFDQMFNSPFGASGQLVQRKATAEPVEIEVKPLPTIGRPANFTGAIGTFKLTAEPTPARVKAGDPITVRLRVEGVGNFDRVEAPDLAEPDGWRAYPPTTEFHGEDEFGLRGVKTFEMAVIAETKKTTSPVFAFSFLDPATGKYQTVRTNAAPLVVEGEPIAPQPPVAAASSFGAPGAVPTPAPAAAKPGDIIGVRYEYGALASMQPLYMQRGFMVAQSVPLAILLGLVAVRFWPRGSDGKLPGLKRERDSLMASWKQTSDRRDFFAKGTRLLQITAAFRDGERSPESLHAVDVARILDADERTTAAIAEIFEAKEHALYAGGGGGEVGESVPRDEAFRLINTVSPLLSR